MAFGISAATYLTVAATAGGAYLNSKAAKKGTDQQAQQGRDANALSERQFEQTREDNAPTRQRGDAAGSRLATLLGLNVPIGSTSTANPRNAELQTYLDRVNADTADLGDNQPSEERDAALERNRQEVARVTAEMSAVQAQDQQAQSADPAFGSLTRNFNAGDRDADPLYSQLRPQIDGALQRSSSFQTSPGYEFRTNEGMKATANTANARNGSYSGATLKALTRFGQDNASSEYNNWFNQSNVDRNFVAGQGQDAFNRFKSNNDTQFNRLSAVAGTGQTATNNVNAAGAQYAQSAGSNLMGIGNVQAAGTVAGANAISGGLSSLANNYQQQIRNRDNSYYPQQSFDGTGMWRNM